MNTRHLGVHSGPAQQDTATTSRHANRSNQHQPMAGAMEHSAPRGQRDAADDEGQNDDGHSSYYDRALELLGIRHVVHVGAEELLGLGVTRESLLLQVGFLLAELAPG